jgi:hypothetical protein
VPGGDRPSTVQQTLPLLPLLLDGSPLVPLPQAFEHPAEKDADEERESEQDVGAHQTFSPLT